MTFSIIIPVYKVENFLQACVTSILNQSYKNFEVILVDDGSPDSCPEICEEIAHNDIRVKVIHKHNGGLSSARNEGLKIAKGEYIVFLDSDDWWSDMDALSRMASKIEDCHPDVILFGGRKYYNNDNVYTGGSEHLGVLSDAGIVGIDQLMRHSAFLACAWDKMIKRSVLIDNRIEFRIGQLSEDIEWCCKLLLLDLRYAVIAGDIHVYRQQNTASITSNLSNKNFEDDLLIFQRYEEVARRTNNTALYNFLALEYLLVIAVTDKVDGNRGKEIIREFSRYFYLLRYNAYPRVAMVSKLRFLGYKNVRRILVWYLNRLNKV